MQDIISKREINSKMSLHNRCEKSYEDFYEVARRDFFLKKIYNTLKKILSH